MGTLFGRNSTGGAVRYSVPVTRLTRFGVSEDTDINWPYSFGQNGLPQSDEVTLTERFTVNEDGSRLDYEITSVDSHTFTEPLTLDKHWVYIPGDEVFALRVHGAIMALKSLSHIAVLVAAGIARAASGQDAHPDLSGQYDGGADRFGSARLCRAWQTGAENDCIEAPYTDQGAAEAGAFNREEYQLAYGRTARFRACRISRGRAGISCEFVSTKN